jgi:hypothetical protein
MAAVYFFRYINSIRKIEDHMALNRPMEWEAMGKPSIFSKKDSVKIAELRKLVETEGENENDLRDLRLIVLGEISKKLNHHMRVTLWSAFGMYVFTIFAVRFLLGQIQRF